MPKQLPKGVSVDRDRHGNVRLYFRAAGAPKVRLREMPGTQRFDDEVACARMGVPFAEPAPKTATQTRKDVAEGSLDWLVLQYRRRAKHMADDQLARRLRLMEEICDSLHKGRRRGSLPFAMMERKHVLEIRDELRDTAGAQNNLIKYFSAMFG